MPAANDVGFANDVRFANDVCLAAHWANIASLRHEVTQHHFERSEKHHIAAGDASLNTPHEVNTMRKEIEINGCVEIPHEMTFDDFTDAFLEFVESKDWHFGGVFKEIVDGYYINPDGTRGKSVLED